jgi:hypothetical protein
MEIYVRLGQGLPVQGETCADSSRLGRAGIFREKEKPVTGTAIPLAKRDM